MGLPSDSTVLGAEVEGPASTPKVIRSAQDVIKEPDWAVSHPIVTPLTYHDAITLVDEAMETTNRFLLRDRLAHLLMTVDMESRKQAEESDLDDVVARYVEQGR